MRNDKPISLPELFKLEKSDMIEIDCEIYFNFIVVANPLEDVIALIDKSFEVNKRDFAFYRLGTLMGYVYMTQDSGVVLERITTFKLLGTIGGKKLLREYLTQLIKAEEEDMKKMQADEAERNKPYG